VTAARKFCLQVFKPFQLFILIAVEYLGYNENRFFLAQFLYAEKNQADAITILSVYLCASVNF
jgi:hypothetical protein